MESSEQLSLSELEMLKKTVRKVNQTSLKGFLDELNEEQLNKYNTFVRERKIDTNTSQAKQTFKRDFLKCLVPEQRIAYLRISELSQIKRIVLKLENILLVNDLLV